MKKSKRLALTLAVLGTISAGANVGFLGENFGIDEAEAARVLSDAEIAERGYPRIPGITYYDNDTASNRGSTPNSIISFDNDTLVLNDNYGGYGAYAFDTSGQSCFAANHRATDVTSYTNSNADGMVVDGGHCSYMFKSWKDHIIIGQLGVGHSWSGGGGDSGSDHYFPILGSYTILSAPGTGAKPEDTRKHMKEAGIDVDGETIKINKPMETKDIAVDGKITTTGDVEIGGNSHVKGDSTVDGNSTVHGNSTVDGDSRIHGSETIDKDLTVYGDTNMKGDAKVDGNFTVNGNTQLGNDKNNDTVDVYAKTHLHGDTTIGDSEKDKLTVNATSEFKADVTFDKDVHIKGDQTVDGNQTIGGDSHIKGNQEIDKDLTVHGNATVGGDLTTKGDSYTLGNSTIGKDLTVGGSAQIGKDLRVEGLTDTGAFISRGDAIIGGNTHIYGDTVLDGSFFAKGATSFDDNVDVKKDLSVGGNTTIAGNAKIGGDTVIDGDVYGRSFNVGSERYIDKDGINANGHKIRNVADGEIGPNSLDAVNGKQLWNTREALQHNINQVGAGAAAMASLHPLDYEHDDKFTFSTAMGNYKDKTALAAGFFYRPNIKSLFNFSGTLGYGENMFGLGFSTKMGKISEVETLTDEQLRDKIATINDDNKELREKNNSLESKMAELKNRFEETIKKDAEQENKISALTTQNADLKKSLSDMTKAYQTLIHKVDGMVEELAIVKAK